MGTGKTMVQGYAFNKRFGYVFTLLMGCIAVFPTDVVSQDSTTSIDTVIAIVASDSVVVIEDSSMLTGTVLSGRFTADSTVPVVDTTPPLDTTTQKTYKPIQARRGFADRRLRNTDSVGETTQTPGRCFQGITRRHDVYALAFVHQTHSFAWGEAQKTAKKMQQLEHREKLPPLSLLLKVLSAVIRVQNGEYQSKKEKKELLRDVTDSRKRCLKIIHATQIADSLLPVYLLIEGGVNGLCATLEIETNLVSAAISGYSALTQLERNVALSASPCSDVYLGLGIFYCLLARSPAIVRAVLTMGGRSISFEKGLDYLRVCAADGRYTSEVAKLYLIQFLSPYMGHLTVEKRQLFSSLQTMYPKNPYYVFLENDENICFHPEVLSVAYGQGVEKKAFSWHPDNYSLHRYRTLVAYQLQYFENVAGLTGGGIVPDTAFLLNEFTFYPKFIAILTGKYTAAPDTKTVSAGLSTINVKKQASVVIRLLGLSAMSSSRMNYYLWHIKNALQLP